MSAARELFARRARATDYLPSGYRWLVFDLADDYHRVHPWYGDTKGAAMREARKRSSAHVVGREIGA